MATVKRSFRDRFFTPPVARAITSPLGILLAGVGAAAGIVLGGGIPLAIGLGAVAWGGRVAVAIPREATPNRIDPFTLGEPWKRAVIDALQAQGRFRDAVRTTEPGPLRERMEEIGQRIDVGVEEAWRVGRQGQNLVAARKRIDDAEARRDLAEAQRDRASTADTGPLGGSAAQESLDRTIESLEAQLASADRLDRTITEARDRLRLTNARLDEAVARATELSVQAGDVGDLVGLGDDVDALVTDLEALRLGLEEASRPATGTA